MATIGEQVKVTALGGYIGQGTVEGVEPLTHTNAAGPQFTYTVRMAGAHVAAPLTFRTDEGYSVEPVTAEARMFRCIECGAEMERPGAACRSCGGF